MIFVKSARPHQLHAYLDFRGQLNPHLMDLHNAHPHHAKDLGSFSIGPLILDRRRR